MNKSHLTRLAACFLAILLALCACAAPESTPEAEPAPVTDVVPQECLEAEPSTGSILLCGECHSHPAHLDRELVLWKECYNKGMRHLIVEQGYCSAQLFNQWMAAEDDERFKYFKRCNLIRSEPEEDFYRQIKPRFPETVFHGADVEHAYKEGAKMLTALEGEDVMCVFGGTHVSETWNNGDSLAQKLRARYGDQVSVEDLTAP